MLTFGSDPEIILIKDGEVISSHSANIKGTKDSPHNLGQGVSVHRDNALLELGIKQASTRDRWVSNHKNALEKARTCLPEGVDFSNLSSAEYSESELWHPECSTFGCESDVSAWDKGANRTVSALDAGNVRVAGGHIHVGYGQCDKELNQKLAKCMDIYLGLPSVLMDKDRARRRLYGQAGSYRDKPYGLEYRVLSNFWLFEDHLLEWAYTSSHRAAMRPGANSRLAERRSDLIAKAINTYDEDLAAALCVEFNVEVVYG